MLAKLGREKAKAWQAGLHICWQFAGKAWLAGAWVDVPSLGAFGKEALPVCLRHCTGFVPKLGREACIHAAGKLA